MLNLDCKENRTSFFPTFWTANRVSGFSLWICNCDFVLSTVFCTPRSFFLKPLNWFCKPFIRPFFWAACWIIFFEVKELLGPEHAASSSTIHEVPFDHRPYHHFFCLWKANLNLGRGLGPLLLEDEGATEAAGIGSPISSTSIGTSAPAVALWLGDCDWLQLSQSPSSSRISITELQPGKIWELMLKEHMRATCSATCNETKCPCGSGSKR